MIRHLGKRYDVLMRCIAAKGQFRCYDVGAHPRTVKSLADDGYLDVVEKGSKTAPYTYVVSDRIRQYYKR